MMSSTAHEFLVFEGPRLLHQTRGGRLDGADACKIATSTHHRIGRVATHTRPLAFGRRGQVAEYAGALDPVSESPHRLVEVRTRTDLSRMGSGPGTCQPAASRLRCMQSGVPMTWLLPLVIAGAAVTLLVWMVFVYIA